MGIAEERDIQGGLDVQHNARYKYYSELLRDLENQDPLKIKKFLLLLKKKQFPLKTT